MALSLLSKKIPSMQDELIEILLENRGIKNKKEKEAFLHPIHPQELSLQDVGIDKREVKKALALIFDAKKLKKRVLVFGDYDADGVCSTAIMWEALNAFGCKVLPFIPHRERHGYGMSKAALDEVLNDAATRPDLVITVDNGIVAHEAVDRLRADGIEVIVTDHHQPEKHGFPNANAVVHTTALCGATVAWMFAKELNKQKAETMLDLCGIATIADQVPLLGANRSFAKHGLDALRTTARPGLHFLFQVAAVEKNKVSVQTVNYGIAPRINAMGRLGDSKDALRLLCSNNMSRIQELATKLHVTNANRQDLTQRLVEKALARKKEWEFEHIIIIDDPEFHDGVIGLVAGKLVEEYWKPAIVIGRGKESSKGSARSIPGVNITEFLRLVRDELIDVGGHPMAAGFSLYNSNIEKVKIALRKIALEKISKEQLIKTTIVDCILPPQLVTLETAEVLRVLEPHGAGNPVPVFLFEKVKVVQSGAVGKAQEHLKLALQLDGGQQLEGQHRGDSEKAVQAIGFGMSEKWDGKKLNTNIDVAGNLQINTWNSHSEAQIVIREINLSFLFAAILM